jgi:putative phosphoesterase
VTKIALLSDTHVPDQIRRLPPRLLDRLQRVDLILHAGDLVDLEVLEGLQAVAPTVAVYGNMDGPAVRRQLPPKRLLTLAGRKIGLIHGNQAPPVRGEFMEPAGDPDAPPLGPFYDHLLGEFPDAEIIVFGHLHWPVVKRLQGRLLVSPGSIAPNRGRSSFALLKLDDPEPEVEVIQL